MTTQFPTDYDDFTNPIDSDSLEDHAELHSDVNDAVEALQAKVGTDTETDPNSHEKRITDLEGGGGGAPADADFLVGTANGNLSGEIVVGTSPGGELGGTWASPTVDATHSGSTHSAATDTHIADATDAHDASAISIADSGNDFDATDVEGALAELQADAETHAAAADPHSVYLKESDFDDVDFLVGTATGHTAAEIVVGTSPGGELGGTWASPTVDATHSGSTHSAATDTHIADTTDVHDHGHLAGLTDDDHTQYQKETEKDQASGYVGYDANGDIALVGDRITTDEAELVLEQTGDTLGDSRLRLQHRVGMNGALFETTDVDLVDFGFKPPTAVLSNIRYEGRAANDFVLAPEFQIGVADDPGLVVANNKNVAVRGGLAVTTAPITQNAKNVLDTDHTAAADPHTGYLKEADVAAKGDIYVASADNTVGVLTVGTDGQIIVANSAEPLGVEWTDNTGGSGAPTDVDYLVGTASGSLSAEIVVGTSPGGELGGTWASPTIDATHSGSTHSAATDTHIADATDAHDASAISIADAGGDFTATDVEGALAELQADNEGHIAAADPHTGYLKEADIAAKGDLFAGTADNTVGILTVGTAGQRLTPNTGEASGLDWTDDTFTVGGVMLDPAGARTVEVWRAPFSCEITAYHARVVGGTNAVTNAQVDSSDILTGDLTTTPADGWEAGTIVSSGVEDVTAGEIIKLEIVSVSGAVTEVSWTITLRRAA